VTVSARARCDLANIIPCQLSLPYAVFRQTLHGVERSFGSARFERSCPPPRRIGFVGTPAAAQTRNAPLEPQGGRSRVQSGFRAIDGHSRSGRTRPVASRLCRPAIRPRVASAPARPLVRACEDSIAATLPATRLLIDAPRAITSQDGNRIPAAPVRLNFVGNDTRSAWLACRRGHASSASDGCNPSRCVAGSAAQQRDARAWKWPLDGCHQNPERLENQ
jgi:hypothetical protein